VVRLRSLPIPHTAQLAIARSSSQGLEGVSGAPVTNTPPTVLSATHACPACSVCAPNTPAWRRVLFVGVCVCRGCWCGAARAGEGAHRSRHQAVSDISPQPVQPVSRQHSPLQGPSRTVLHIAATGYLQSVGTGLQFGSSVRGIVPVWCSCCSALCRCPSLLIPLQLACAACCVIPRLMRHACRQQLSPCTWVGVATADFEMSSVCLSQQVLDFGVSLVTCAHAARAQSFGEVCVAPACFKTAAESVFRRLGAAAVASRVKCWTVMGLSAHNRAGVTRQQSEEQHNDTRSLDSQRHTRQPKSLHICALI
jgi:hypothetical protein